MPKLENKEPNNIPTQKYFVPNCGFILPHHPNTADNASQTITIKVNG
jgi:hypothetical protein